LPAATQFLAEIGMSNDDMRFARDPVRNDPTAHLGLVML
jgi:hypothetical protein